MHRHVPTNVHWQVHKVQEHDNKRAHREKERELKRRKKEAARRKAEAQKAYEEQQRQQAAGMCCGVKTELMVHFFLNALKTIESKLKVLVINALTC